MDGVVLVDVTTDGVMFVAVVTAVVVTFGAIDVAVTVVLIVGIVGTMLVLVTHVVLGPAVVTVGVEHELCGVIVWLLYGEYPLGSLI